MPTSIVFSCTTIFHFIYPSFSHVRWQLPVIVKNRLVQINCHHVECSLVSFPEGCIFPPVVFSPRQTPSSEQGRWLMAARSWDWLAQLLLAMSFVRDSTTRILHRCLSWWGLPYFCWASLVGNRATRTPRGSSGPSRNTASGMSSAVVSFTNSDSRELRAFFSTSSSAFSRFLPRF